MGSSPSGIEPHMTRLFLAIVGIAYLGLAAWCALKPGQTSNSVGLTLQPGSGQSEYLVVYGGLQLGLGLIFLWPLLKSDTEQFVLVMCLVIHACLVLMRSISLAIYPGIQSTTYALAVIEWLILLGSLWRFFSRG